MSGYYVTVVFNVLSIVIGLLALGVSIYFTRPRKDEV